MRKVTLSTTHRKENYQENQVKEKTIAAFVAAFGLLQALRGSLVADRDAFGAVTVNSSISARS